MNRTIQFLLTLMICSMFSSCGIITKTRYGNGFKINIGNGYNMRNGKQYPQAHKIQSVPGKIQKTNLKDTCLITTVLQQNSDTMLSDAVQASTQANHSNTILKSRKPHRVKKAQKKNIATEPGKKKFSIVDKLSEYEPWILVGAASFYTFLIAGTLTVLGIFFPPMFIVPVIVGLTFSFGVTFVGFWGLDDEGEIKGKWLAWSVFGTIIGGLALAILGLMIYLTLF